MSGTLFIVAAPSGAGKTSLTRALLERERGIQLSVSYTSRPPRPGEVDGVHYHFVSRPVFELMVERGEFFEHAVVHGDLKGTARKPVFDALAAGSDVLLEIDWQGARQVREVFPDAIAVFILPPSIDILESRLRGRATDSEEVIARRLSEARAEIDMVAEYDYLIVNDDFATARQDLISVIRCQRLTAGKQLQRYSSSIAAMQTAR